MRNLALIEIDESLPYKVFCLRCRFVDEIYKDWFWQMPHRPRHQLDAKDYHLTRGGGRRRAHLGTESNQEIEIYIRKPIELIASWKIFHHTPQENSSCIFFPALLKCADWKVFRSEKVNIFHLIQNQMMKLFLHPSSFISFSPETLLNLISSAVAENHLASGKAVGADFIYDKVKFSDWCFTFTTRQKWIFLNSSFVFNLCTDCWELCVYINVYIFVSCNEWILAFFKCFN